MGPGLGLGMGPGGVWRLGRGIGSRWNVDTLKGGGVEVEFENRKRKRVEFGDREEIGGGWTKVGDSLVAGPGGKVEDGRWRETDSG